MPARISVIISQSQSRNPRHRAQEETLVTSLLGETGIEVTLIPHLYNLRATDPSMIGLINNPSDLIICSWIFPRAAHWSFDRLGVRGTFGRSLLKAYGESDEEHLEALNEQQSKTKKSLENKAGTPLVIASQPRPDRKIYSLDLRAYDSAEIYIQEIRRIVNETATQTVDLMSWVSGSPSSDQMHRFISPTNDTALGLTAKESNGENSAETDNKNRTSFSASGTIRIIPAAPKQEEKNGTASAESSDLSAKGLLPKGPVSKEADSSTEGNSRRWYPVIDFSRCTSCMECIDFCLFGVYGADASETILVEQPDNCRKGCPACSRVCPENAIMFPQHKNIAIAGSSAEVASVKIDLSVLFGAPDPGANGAADAASVAARERDEQLLIAGLATVDKTFAEDEKKEIIAKHQHQEQQQYDFSKMPLPGGASSPASSSDPLDLLMDQLDTFDL